MWTWNCYDNDSSVIKCFFGNLKTETGDLGQFRTGQKFMDKTWQYITYCNEKWIQQGLGGRSQKWHSEHMMRHGVA